MGDREFIDKLNAIIEANFQRDDLGVAELAQKLHLSRSQLHRKLTAARGISASAYIKEFRLKRALSLLQQRPLTSSEVAYQVGFSSPSYFSTCFKQYYSYSPSQVKIQEPLTTFEGAVSDLPKGFSQNERTGHKGNTKNVLQRKFLLSIGFIGLAIASFFIFKGSHSETNQNKPMLIKDKSIAVLPFRNYSNDQSLEAFCDGMTDELISKLSNLADFDRVISRTSTYKFKNMQLSVPEIASELGVAYILEGSIQKADGKIRVNIQLIDANLDDHVWTDHYTGDWESRDIFDIQQQITSFVANAMQVAITANESERVRKNATQNKQAYDLYLQAKFHMFSNDEESMENARQMLGKCIALDSTFARAYSDLGFIWFASGLSEGIRNQDIAWNKGKYYLNRAQDLDPSLIKNEFNLLQGYFYFDWDFRRLEEFYHARFSKYTYDRESCGLIDYAIKTGRFKAALEVINKSIEADPLDAVLFSFKARALWFLGEKEESIAILEQMDKLNKNDWFYLREAVNSYFIMKEHAHSRRVLDIVMERFEDRSPNLIWLKLFYAHMDENIDQENARLNELQEAYTNGNSGSPAWFIALYQLTIMKDKVKTFEWLEKSYDAKEVELTWIQQEPLLEPIRNDERYLSLYRKIGFDKLISN
ncbi:MAG: hypothetical protein DHS20C17_05590 [Cyclobacteriaceae bacterium]|nr:MAG: hypothetical protein DHS20C17_05590 [Cyclobacteriaceae bacterium]